MQLSEESVSTNRAVSRSLTDSGLSLFLFKNPVGGSAWVWWPWVYERKGGVGGGGGSRPGKRGEDPGSWSSERGCLISAGPSDGFDRAQAPIRLQD